MAVLTVHCITCGREIAGSEGKAHCPSCGQDFEYTMVARVQGVLDYQRPVAAPAKRLDRLCRAALTVSFFSCAFPLIAASAAGLAIAGLVRIRKTRQDGAGHAIAALILSLLGTLVFIRFYTGLNAARATAVSISCSSNLRQLGQHIMMHESDYPRAQEYSLADLQVWDPTIAKEVFRCPNPDGPAASSSGGVQSSYVMLTCLQPFRRIEEPGEAAILFELTPHHIPADDGIPEVTGHNVLFADGHVEQIDVEDLPALIESSLVAPRR